MSRRKVRREADAAASKAVLDRIAPLLEAAKGTPLPDDILMVATERYGRGYCLPTELTRAQRSVEQAIRNALPDVAIFSGKRNSPSSRRNARASLVMLPKAVPFRRDEYFLGMYTYAFGYWRNRFLYISAIEPGGASTHLHQRVLQRSHSVFSSLAEAQDRFSDLWPTIVELGQRRRKSGRRANVTNFISPWADGLMFGDFSRVDIPPGVEGGTGPQMLDYDPARRIAYEHHLRDWYSRGEERSNYFLRTYVGPAELRPHQAELHAKLVDFCIRHKTVTLHFKNVARLGIWFSDGAGEELADILGMPAPSAEQIDQAIAKLDELSSSDLWLSEIAKSKESRERAKKKEQGTA